MTGTLRSVISVAFIDHCPRNDEPMLFHLHGLVSWQAGRSSACQKSSVSQKVMQKLARRYSVGIRRKGDLSAVMETNPRLKTKSLSCVIQVDNDALELFLLTLLLFHPFSPLFPWRCQHHMARTSCCFNPFLNGCSEKTVELLILEPVSSPLVKYFHVAWHK